MSSLMEIKCRKCGTTNTLPNLHCKQCGAPLDYAESERRLNASAQRRLPLGKYMRNLLLLVVVAGLALLLWPETLVRDISGDRLDAKRYTMMGEILLNALNLNVQTNMVIAERDMNAFLAFQVRGANENSDGGAFSAQYRAAGVHFAEDAGTAWISMKRGPATISSEVFFSAGEGGLSVTGAKVGHLPLPGALGRLYAKTQSSLFAKFKNEGRILRNLESAQLQDGSLSLTTRVNPPAAARPVAE